MHQNITFAKKKAKMLLVILRSHYSDYLVSLEFLKQQKTILKYRKMYRKLFGTISHLKYPKIQFCIITQRFRPEITQPLHIIALTFQNCLKRVKLCHFSQTQCLRITSGSIRKTTDQRPLSKT